MRKRTMSLLLGFCIAAGMGHASPAGAVNSEIDLSKMQPVVMILPTSANIGMMRGISILDANMIDALEGGTCTAYLQSGGTVAETEQSYCWTATDESAVKVTDSGTFILSDSTITGAGNTSSPDDSSFYGLNAGVLATSSSTIDLSNCTVSTTGTGANGVFATGTGSSVTLSDVTINCTGQLAHGVDATLGGMLTLTNVDIVTAGANAAAIATDRGSGTITVTGGAMTTSGVDSPGIYSTGSITVSGATITATGSEGAVIEGENSITLTNTTLSGSKKWGVMIYQSMSGDAAGVKGTFEMTGGSLSAAVGPLFYVTNSTGVIRLTGVTVAATSGTLVNAAAGNWGVSGSNGGIATFTADGETLTGDLTTDSISSITATLQNDTSLTGYINSAALILDSTSSWHVTGNSCLTSLTDASGISGSTITNIYGNGYTVLYDASQAANSWLGGGTYTLNGGGYLTPGAAISQLQVFARGSDNTPWQIYWDGSKWKGWTPLNGATNEAPALASYGGSLQLFVRGLDYGLYQASWDGSRWQGWYAHGGYLASAPSVVTYNGQFHVFAAGGDHALWWIYWDGSKWNGWYPLGGYILGTPSAVSYNGQLHVFVTGGDNALYRLTWDGSNWNGWYRSDGYLAYGPGAVSWNGQLHVFAVSGDHALYDLFWDGSKWNGWYPLGGYIIGSPAPVDYNGQLDVFVASGDHAVWWDTFDGTKWSGWNYLGGFTPSAPGVASCTPGG